MSHTVSSKRTCRLLACDLSNYFCLKTRLSCTVSLRFDTVHSLHWPLCHAAAKLAGACSATCRLGNDRQRLAYWVIHAIARFSRIAAYVSIRIVKTHQRHEKLDRLLGRGDKRRHPLSNYWGACPTYPPRNRRPWNRRTLIVGGWTMKLAKAYCAFYTIPFRLVGHNFATILV